MPLTHVCVWEPDVGYRRISVEEACQLYPYGASARSGTFVCELCAQNVVLTTRGYKRQHFRHNSAALNKECEERDAYFDPTYGRSIRDLSSHVMPLRIVLTGSTFSFQLGFFTPPTADAVCSKIKIGTDSHQIFTYSFERIEQSAMNYLGVGSIPSKKYSIAYEHASPDLHRYWPNSTSGISASGTFFDGITGKMILSGGKAIAGNTYYLLQREALSSYNRDIEATELMRVNTDSYVTWYLYKIRVKEFSFYSAQFFLRRFVFLTTRPTKFYPIWPPYTQEMYFIYHNSNVVYLYLCGDDAELKAFPITVSPINTQDGKLYELYTSSKEQLVSIGKAGALGYSYLIKRPLPNTTGLAQVLVSDAAGNELSEDVFRKLPKQRLITATCPYDGKAVVRKAGKTEHVFKVSAGEDLVIDGLSYDTEIWFYQGCDCVRRLCFERKPEETDTLVCDHRLATELMNCTGPMIPVSHSLGMLALKYNSYPQTKKWIYKKLRQGEMPYSAYKLLISGKEINPC